MNTSRHIDIYIHACTTVSILLNTYIHTYIHTYIYTDSNRSPYPDPLCNATSLDATPCQYCIKYRIVV